MLPHPTVIAVLRSIAGLCAHARAHQLLLRSACALASALCSSPPLGYDPQPQRSGGQHSLSSALCGSSDASCDRTVPAPLLSSERGGRRSCCRAPMTQGRPGANNDRQEAHRRETTTEATTSAGRAERSGGECKDASADALLPRATGRTVSREATRVADADPRVVTLRYEFSASLKALRRRARRVGLGRPSVLVCSLGLDRCVLCHLSLSLSCHPPSSPARATRGTVVRRSRFLLQLD